MRDQVGIRLAVGDGLPTVQHQRVHVVLNALGSVIHQVLVGVIRIQQRRGLECTEKAFGK